MRRRHDPIAMVPRRPWLPTRGGAGDRPGPGEQVPEAFRWRGRVYVVTEVLGHWVEAAAWWRPGQPRSPAPAGRQRRWWRVAARPSHPAARGATGVYELCCSGGAWSLRRVHD